MDGKFTEKKRLPGSGREWRFPLDEEEKEKRLAAISQAVGKKQLRYYPSFWEKLWNQLRFQSWKYRMSQGAVLLAAMLLVLYLEQKETAGTESITVCSVFLVFSGNICLSGIGRLFSWHMAELEQTLYLNLKQMVCIGMLEAGLIDLAVLSVLTGFAGKMSQLGTGTTLLYMLVPFLWSDILYLQMLTALRNTQPGYRHLAAGLLCCLLALFPVLLKDRYNTDYLPVWALGAVAGVLLLAAQIYRMLGKMEGGDSLCLN